MEDNNVKAKVQLLFENTKQYKSEKVWKTKELKNKTTHIQTLTPAITTNLTYIKEEEEEDEEAERKLTIPPNRC